MNPMLHRLSTFIATTCMIATVAISTNPEAARATKSNADAVGRRTALFLEPPHRPSVPTAPGTTATGAPAEALALASCPSGWYCFYDEAGFGTPVGKLSDCGWQNLATWGWQNRINSAYYNLASGSASFYENNGTYLFQVSATSRSRIDVSPLQNKADKVYRSCA